MLLEVPLKIIANIVHMRLQCVLESAKHVDHEQQCGFSSDRATCDASFTVKQVIKKQRELGLEIELADVPWADSLLPAALEDWSPDTSDGAPSVPQQVR